MAVSDPIVNRIRIIPRQDDFLDRNVGSSGEIYFSNDTKTLRLYDGNERGGYEVVVEDNIAINTANKGVSSVTYDVVVVGPQGSDTGNKYQLNGDYKPDLVFVIGYTYVLDQSDSTNLYYPNAEGTTLNEHPLFFSITADGTHNSGTYYETGVQYILDGEIVTRTRYIDRFNAATNRKIMLTVTKDTPTTLYYFCQYHSGMGGEIERGYPGSGSGGASITVSDTAPDSPEAGALWFNSTNGKLFVYVTDVDSSQWVQPTAPNYVSGGSNITNSDDVTEGSTNLFHTDERVDDRVNSLLQAGDNITLTYNDVANTLTIASTGGGGGGVDLTAFSVGAEGAATGDGNLAYDNSTGVFTYSPPDLSGYLTGITSGQVTTALGYTPYNGSTNPNGFISTYTETDTLDDVVGRGATTTTAISTGAVTSSGTVTATDFVTTGTGTPELSSASTLTLDSADGTIVTGGVFRLPSLTTTERNALTAANGDMIYNTTDNKVQVYENGAWANVI